MDSDTAKAPHFWFSDDKSLEWEIEEGGRWREADRARDLTVLVQLTRCLMLDDSEYTLLRNKEVHIDLAKDLVTDSLMNKVRSQSWDTMQEYLDPDRKVLFA